MKSLVPSLASHGNVFSNTLRSSRYRTFKKNDTCVSVAFEFDDTYFPVGSHSQEIFRRTRKYKNVGDGGTKVVLAIDDLRSIDPWRPREIRVYGSAEIVERYNGIFGLGKYLRITPKVSWSFGIEGLELKEGEWSHKTLH